MSDSLDAMDIDGSVDIEISDDFFSDPLFYHAPLDAFQLMQYDEARLHAQSASKGWMARLFSAAQESAIHSPATLDRMLSHQSDPLQTPLLQTSAKFHDRAIEMFKDILQLTKQTDACINTALRTTQKLLQWGLEVAELRDELFMQIFKQTRGDVNDATRLRSWKLFHLVAATMPPSRDYRSLLTHYVHQVSHDDQEIEDIRTISVEIWNAFKRSVRSGVRKTLLTLEEINMKLSGYSKMKSKVYFLDGTCEEFPYDIGTTVLEAVENLAAVIGLANCHSFSLFEGHYCADRVKGLEHIQLYDHSYIADVLHEFALKDRDGNACRLVFKKVMFRETDVYIVESQFLNLSYLQAQYDLLMGNYPVGYEDAAKLCALQLFSEFGQDLPKNQTALKKSMDGFTSADVHLTGSREAWRKRVLEQYHRLNCVFREDARDCFLSLLRSLPYGMAIFFKVDRLQDPIGLLPARLILGINKNGLHFLRWLPKEYLSSVDFRDITQFGFCSRSIYFKMKVSSRMHSFQFGTNRGQDICMALKTHISDAARRAQAPDKNTDTALAEANFGENYDQHLNKIQKAIHEAESKREQMLDEQQKVVTEIGHSRAQLQNTKLCLQQVEALKDNIHKEVSFLQSEILNQRSELERLNSLPSLDAVHMEQLLKKEQHLRSHLDKGYQDNSVMQRRVAEMEERRCKEMREWNTMIDAVVSDGRGSCASKDNHMASLIEQIANVNAMMHANTCDVLKFKKEKDEWTELKKMRAEVEAREHQYTTKVEEQKERIDNLESMSKSLQIDRKRIFNNIQDMKGKIRVYARVRPVLDLEEAKGQMFALDFPDALSISHQWKRDSCPREYAFDGVFVPEATQNEVFCQTEDLIQSTIDGYNVCIFAYGQTGSGKTYTIYGDDSHPGLAPRGIEKLFELLHKKSAHCSFSVTCFMLELYRDSLMDLLSDKKTRTASTGRRHSELPVPSSSSLSFTPIPRLSECPSFTLDNRRLSELAHPKERLEIKRDKGVHSMVHVQGVTMVEVHSAEELIATFEGGERHRHVASTQMNIQSSRSHLIMSMIVQVTDLQTLSETRGKLTFVDLAGSERLKKSGSAGEQLKEAQAINKSLSALGDVISSLARGDAHVPYRNHKLTMLMSDSIGGNAKTLMFVNVSPTDANLAETQNSLQYATRVRTIKNEASKESNKEAVKLKKQISFWKSMDSDKREDKVRKMIQDYM